MDEYIIYKKFNNVDVKIIIRKSLYSIHIKYNKNDINDKYQEYINIISSKKLICKKYPFMCENGYRKSSILLILEDNHINLYYEGSFNINRINNNINNLEIQLLNLKKE